MTHIQYLIPVALLACWTSVAGCPQQAPPPVVDAGTVADAGGAVAETPDGQEAPEHSLVVLYDGEAFDMPKGLEEVYVLSLFDAAGREYELGGMALRYWQTWACNVCPSDDQLPGKLPDVPYTFKPGHLTGFRGPATYFVPSKCKSGIPCRDRVPVPPGEYTLKMRGLIECPDTRVVLPLTQDMVVPCRRRTEAAAK